MIDAHERAELEAQSKEIYDHQIDELRHNGYDERKIRELTRAVILKKSVDEIKEYADYQKYVRKSPERYEHVQSKVARNLKVQKSSNRRTRKERVGPNQDSTSQNRASEYKWTYEEFAQPPKRSKSPKYKSSQYYRQFLE